MADTFADAFKRYWAIILTVAGALLYAGGVYSNVQAQIANLNSDIRGIMYLTNPELMPIFNGQEQANVRSEQSLLSR